MIRRSLFHTPTSSPPSQEARVEIIEPVRGFNRHHPATNLIPGETPFSQNWLMGDKFIEPRSGVSQWGTLGSTGTPLTFFNATRVDRTEEAIVYSTSTIKRRTDAATWVAQAITPAFSSSTDGYFNVASVNQIASTVAVAAIYFTNWELHPKTIGITATTVTDFTEFYSIDSYARYVVPFDERLVFFHSGSTNTGAAQSQIHATRVSWSARGNTSDFTNGGFEDLVDMQGTGTGIVSERDRLVLLSEKEVWGGRPRRDAYAFDFFTLDKAKGCPKEYDRTPRNTEAGTIWLGSGFQFNHLVGNDVRAIGDKVRDLLSDEMREWRHCWALHNPNDHVYALFYSDTTGEYATKALFLRTDTIVADESGRYDGIWFLQDFGALQLTTGGVFGKDNVLISSKGTAYRMLSSQTNDNGVSIDARWRSHSMRGAQDIFLYDKLQEIWMEYEHTSAITSSLSFFSSANNAATFVPIAATSLISGVGTIYVPANVQAARSPIFEMRLNDGTRPRIARMQARLRTYTGRQSGV